ncbi:amino acid permease [Legionella longbeachae]|uniref:Putative amino acid permease n=1 Tax=Legionella longbeachae serogroup 1 (strain NSW150) TaxID=661367 RepID=D3HNB5_LEGLN|nr:amino acid permease [Legionella longbeachae]VEE00904.1 amino acid permease [Legionella oakridgensis]HBD7399020.1 amino acid permease [Legionella pneumophila]ARB92703.1 amino acid permease [Legionella longbeachae]ARM34123.1 amino acid permease [Legionella longbeachae]EEZ96639.1 amino acid permease family protein [Legionella longbeachae D-4968]
MDLFRKKEIGESFEEGSSLVKCLTAFDLTLLGIGAIIGAGIFVLTGIVAATDAGPAVIFSYILAGLACIFSALSYAELASSLGGCGSAYGYAYAGFGEIVAWIVGWDLLFEYTISVSAVSVGWSSYANDFFLALKIHIPAVFLHGPENGGFFNLLACSIIVILMVLLTWGVKSSIRVNNIMVIIKLLVILMFIVIALGEVDPSNWSPFFPYGWEGVVKGASLIFFAYIGFDAVSTAAEEAINPQRDLPIGIIGSLFICTVLYMIVAGLLTGIAHYSTLNVASPISHALLVLGYKSVASLISVGAIAGLTTVMLVLFYGLTRIMLAMSRDGLLPKVFSQTNPYTHTPIRVILISGILMSLFAALVSMHDLTELVNIGTLFAFLMVCAGVLYLHYKRPDLHRPFKTPGMPYVPILGMISCSYLIINLPFITLMRFVIWMAIGLVVYFSFAYKNSQLSKVKIKK